MQQMRIVILLVILFLLVLIVLAASVVPVQRHNMSWEDLLVFCLAQFVGCNGICLSDGVPDLDLATRLWSFLELTPTYLEGLSL